MLNLSRAAQGVGGAIMFATSLALIAQAFAGTERGTAFGIYGAVVGGAVAVGPLVGGAITTGIGWRWIFFVNIPIGVVAVIITLTKVDERQDPDRPADRLARVRHLHLVALPARLRAGAGQRQGLGQHVHRVDAGGARPSSWSSSSSASGSSRTRCSTSASSSGPAMVGVSLGSFTLSASIFAMFLYLTLYIQEVLGYGPLAAGLRFLPLTMLAFIVAPFAGQADRAGPDRAS